MTRHIHNFSIGVSALILALSLGLGILPAGPVKDTLVITGMTDSAGFTPTQTGNPSEYHYATTIPSNTAVADTIPVQFDLSNDNGTNETFTITMNAVGQLASSFNFDASPFTMTAPSSGAMHYVYINTLSLAPGDYTANVQISAEKHGDITVEHATLHFLIHVVDPDPAANCFITDSTGLKLLDCSGNPVSTGGEFLIVSNSKRVTATNPGQFYYNLIWTNQTGSDVTFTSLGLSGANVVPQGANSVHVLIYNANSFVASFDDVNNDGTPCGQNGTVCKSPITVPNGQTLWLTWHVAYQWIGSPLFSDIPPFGSCGLPSLHGTIAMSALLQNADQSVKVGCGPVYANGHSIK